jgi:hypothetical protein
MFVLPLAGLKQIHLVHSWVKLKDICSFSGMHTEFSSESKTYMARNPDNVCSVQGTCGICVLEQSIIASFYGFSIGF